MPQFTIFIGEIGVLVSHLMNCECLFNLFVIAYLQLQKQCYGRGGAFSRSHYVIFFFNIPVVLALATTSYSFHWCVNSKTDVCLAHHFLRTDPILLD